MQQPCRARTGIPEIRLFQAQRVKLLKSDARTGGSQVLDLQPAQGGFVECTFAEDGLYPFVTHKFANVGKGALGFFAVGNVDTSALGGH